MSEYSYVEQPILTWLCGEPKGKYEARGLGWTYRDEAAMAEYERPLEDPLVERLLVAAILRINLDVKTEAQAKLAVAALRKTMSHPDRLTANRQTLDLLRDGAKVTPNPGEDAKTVHFIAFDPARQDLNDFTATNLYRVQGVKQCREDTVLLVNGIPLVIAEYKSYVASGKDWREAVHQLHRYQRQAPLMLTPNLFCVAADEDEFRFGTVLFHDAGHVLNREDADAAAIVQNALLREGVELVLGCRIHKVAAGGGGKSLRFACEGGGEREVVVDEILVGVGRAPNVADLGLESVGVAFDAKRGVHVDDQLRTTNRRIFAVGDVAMDWKFTHAADAAAKIVVQNALFFRRLRLSDLVMPWCTYTDPEVAHVGIQEHEARARGIELDTFTIPLERVNRAVCDGEEEGFVKLHVKKGSDRILGATLVAAHAGEMIPSITLAMVAGLGLSKIAQAIHPYPTQAEGIKAAANAYLRTRLTPRVARLFARFLAWTR